MVDAPVHRDGKWAELYTGETYPYWPQGSCSHAVSRPVAAYVAQKAAADALTLYQREKTSLGYLVTAQASSGEFTSDVVQVPVLYQQWVSLSTVADYWTQISPT
jgi:hypothetical protein